MSKKYTIGQLFTPPVQDHDADDFEIGNFELYVRVDRKLLRQDPDKQGMVKSAIAQHLASACRDTQSLPEMWRFQPSEEAKRDFNLTSLNFGAQP